MAWSLREHQKEPHRLAHLLYWQQARGPEGAEDVIYQNDHSFLSVLAYRGVDMESADKHELMALRARAHAVVLSLGGGWMVQNEVRRHAAAPYPVSPWAHPVAALVDEERREQVGRPGTHFETSYYWVLTWQIPRQRGHLLRRMWWANVPTGHAQVNALTQFREEVARVQGQLVGIFPAREEHPGVELLTGDALATYLHSTASAHTQEYVHMPDPAWWLNYDLSDSAFQPGVTPYLGDKLWLRPVVVKNEHRRTCMPETTYPGILECLDDLPLEYRAVRRWIALSHAQARKELNDLENLARGEQKTFWTQFAEKRSGREDGKVEEAAVNEAAAISQARGLLEEGVIAFGYQTLSVLVWDEQLETAEANAELVCQVLRGKGFLASVEQIDAVGAWLSMMPGDSYHIVERPMISSLNAVDLFALTSVDAGPQWVPHLNGPAVFVGTAKGQTPYRVSTHQGDVGDFLVVSPKGSGKSTLGAFYGLQWQRYDKPRVSALDKGGSLKAATLGMDGNWINLAPGTARPLQPFARIDDPAEAAWAVEWVEDVLELEGFTREPSLNTLLWSAMQSLATFPVQHRTLSGYSSLVQGSQIREALSRYTADGQFPILDGDEDWLRVSHWTCFEMETLLDDFPRLVYPVSKILFRRIEQALDGSPTFLWTDELHAYFPAEGATNQQALIALAQKHLSWSKTLRRRNVTLGYATQNPLDLLRWSVGMELINACTTVFFGANPRAITPRMLEVYHDLFGLTPRQCAILAAMTPKRDYYYVGPHGTRRFRLDLGPVALAFCGRSRLPDLRKMDEVAAATTEPFGVAWLRAEGREDLANLLGEAYAYQEPTVDRYYADTDEYAAAD